MSCTKETKCIETRMFGKDGLQVVARANNPKWGEGQLHGICKDCLMNSFSFPEETLDERLARLKKDLRRLGFEA